MPYKSSGNWVLVFKNGKWKRYKLHKSPEQAKRHAQALNINVSHK